MPHLFHNATFPSGILKPVGQGNLRITKATLVSLVDRPYNTNRLDCPELSVRHLGLTPHSFEYTKWMWNVALNKEIWHDEIKVNYEI